MSSPGVAPGRWVRPDDVGALADLLRRSGATIESELQGPSMEPTLEAGTRLRITCGNLEACTPGTVVAVMAPAGLVAHRVVARSRQHLLTRGDASTACDPPVPLSQVLGPVSAIQRHGAWTPVPALPHQPPLRRLLGFINQLDVRVALAVHPVLGRLAALRGLRLRNALVRLRHGPRGR